MPSVEYYVEVSKQNFQVKVYSLLCLVLVAVIGFYGYVRVQEYLALQEIVAESDELISNLELEAATERAQYESVKGEFSAFLESLNKKMENIFPVADNYILLTRQFDYIEDSFATLTNTFQISNLVFSEPVYLEDYSILPVRVTIASSLVNFDNFLKLIENSGDFDAETRLMDLTSVRLSFPSGANTKNNEIINFTVSLNAYFQ
ncbi:hypothetical protein CVV38_01860 [Candidatus Peregrinibacteria bacterium HGW-Peregrinibacteria-1]|jgi:hypothetical protein|nr:MAG: hypothetical protein CVV38_01860 [Candidatus Peregrinibacteria bacterium HGW-Peregrinibacteria-1]